VAHLVTPLPVQFWSLATTSLMAIGVGRRALTFKDVFMQEAEVRSSSCSDHDTWKLCYFCCKSCAAGHWNRSFLSQRPNVSVTSYCCSYAADDLQKFSEKLLKYLFVSNKISAQSYHRNQKRSEYSEWKSPLTEPMYFIG